MEIGVPSFSFDELDPAELSTDDQLALQDLGMLEPPKEEKIEEENKE